MMKKNNRDFKNKFHLLYSQGSSEKIIWSSSDSSDYENVYYENKFEHRKDVSATRKRKRHSKLKNISYLDVVYVEDKQKATHNTHKKHGNEDLKKSPIVSIPLSTNECISRKSLQSPILPSKTLSPIQSPKVRKKLFCSKERLLLQEVNKNVSDNSILQYSKERNKKISPHNKLESDFSTIDIINKSYVEHNRPMNQKVVSNSVDLVKRVKSYFENRFNCETSSQNSISEYESTQQSNTKADDIDIQSLTDDNEKCKNVSSEDSSLDMDDTRTSKTLKLKKDGLAYRLNSLLRKQNASMSMWLNEKFLASNSKFSLPKGDFTVFRIQNMQLKYGLYLLEAKDIDNISYSVIINPLHLNNVNLEANTLLKLFKPYECLTINNCNIIVNVLKFECDNICELK